MFLIGYSSWEMYSHEPISLYIHGLCSIDVGVIIACWFNHALIALRRILVVALDHDPAAYC